MLIRFSVENFLSFRDRQELSMVKGLQRSLSNHIIDSGANRKVPDLLKLSGIYGANGAGKSNLIKSMAVAQSIISNTRRPGELLPLTPFALDSAFENKPTLMEFEFVVNGIPYSYGFTASSKKILEEWLVRIGEQKDEVVYERGPNGAFNVSGVVTVNREERAFIENLAKAIGDNNLLLAEIHEHNVRPNLTEEKSIFDAIDWFTEKLVIIFPESHAAGFEPNLIENLSLRKICSRLLSSVDTGIDSIELENLELDSLREIPDALKHDLIKDSTYSTAVISGNNARFVVKKQDNGKPVATRIVTKHLTQNVKDGDHRIWGLEAESDGTRRFFDLIPGLVNLIQNDMVFVVDELNRSLHPDLVISFIKNFILHSNKRSQMIFSTHETTLLNQKYMRRDEIWVVRKNAKRASELVSLQDFQMRADKDLRKAYFQGRFGGIPRISEMSWLKELKNTNE